MPNGTSDHQGDKGNLKITGILLTGEEKKLPLKDKLAIVATSLVTKQPYINKEIDGDTPEVQAKNLIINP